MRKTNKVSLDKFFKKVYEYNQYMSTSNAVKKVIKEYPELSGNALYGTLRASYIKWKDKQDETNTINSKRSRTNSLYHKVKQWIEGILK